MTSSRRGRAVHVTFEELVGRFALEPSSELAGRLALRLRIGAESQHRDLTFADVHALAKARAAALHALGCRRGERVALLMPQSEQLLTLFIGCLYSGLVPSIIATPTAKMDSAKYRRNVRSVVGALKADWLVTTREMVEILGTSIGNARVIDPSRVDIEGALPVESAVRRDGIAFIQYSGGTTGTQKSIPVTYDMLLAALNNYAEALELTDTDRVITWLPMYHDLGLIGALVIPFVYGLPVTMFSAIEWVTDPIPFLRAIGEHRATVSWMPNFAFGFMANRAAHLRAGALDLSSMRALLNGSEPTQIETVDAFADAFAKHALDPAALHFSYGMAEAVFGLTTTNSVHRPRRTRISSAAYRTGRLEPDPHGDRTLISVGPPIAGVSVRIVDDAGRELPPGGVGEIWLKGESMLHDYLDAASSDKGPRWAFTDGWYRSGDLGAVLDGHVYVTGRKKDLIIVGGVNVYPEEVESAVGDLPDIHPGRVVALGTPDEAAATEELVVVAEVNDEADLLDADRIEAEIRQATLAVTTVAPKRVFIVPPKWMIKSTAGKVSRPETRAKLGELERRVTAPEAPAAPRTWDLFSVRNYLVDALANALGTTSDKISEQSPVRSLGVGSLTTARLQLKIERDIGVNLPFQLFFTDTTIRDVAKEIVRALENDTDAARHRQSS